jgi:hypothetical protein
MGEVDDTNDPEDNAQPEGDDCVDAARLNSQDKGIR